jgi:preprotein translocase subunit SecG
MATIVSILIFIVCILLILVVLVQNSKGGGLSSSFASSNQILGVKQTTDWLEKATWSLAVTLVVLCLLSAAVNSGSEKDRVNKSSEIKDLINSEPITPPAGFQNNPTE